MSDVHPIPPPVLAQDTPIVMGLVLNQISLIQGPRRISPRVTRLSTTHGFGPGHGAPTPQAHAEESGGVRLPLFFWLDWQHFRGASCVRSPPQSVPSAGGGGFYGSPTLGTTRDSVHVPTSVRSPICKCSVYSGLSPASYSRATPPPCEGPRGPAVEGGHHQADCPRDGSDSPRASHRALRGGKATGGSAGPTDLIAFGHHIEFGPRQSGLPMQRI